MNINDLKPLTTDQYDKAKETALERIRARIGEQPNRKTFERELGPLWNVLDVLALIVFAAALLVSSVHIMQHMGGLAEQSYTTQIAGTRIHSNFWVAAHQWGYIALSEASMILFMALFGINRTWRRWVFVTLALVAAGFVVIANISSGTGLLESIMPPIFTLGIGFHLERLIVSSLKRQRDVTTRYLAAQTDYETGSKDPESHSKFDQYFMQALWDRLISLKANRDFSDAPAAFKVAACRREMQREQWINAAPDEHLELPTPDKPEGEQRYPFGSIHPASEPGGHASIRMNGNAGAHRNNVNE